MSPQALPFFILLAFLIAPEMAARPAQSGAPATTVSSSGSDQNSTTNSPSATAADKPAKKVWSNDDLPGLRDDANATVGTQRAEPTATRQKPVYPRARSAKSYHDQIAALQARIPKLDNQLAQLRAGIDGKFTGDGKTSERPFGVRVDDWSLELKKLQAQRADLTSKISALEDEARHNGIPENALP